MKKILNEIEKWTEKKKNNVMFIGSFVEFKKDGEVGNSSIIGYGPKECIGFMLEDIEKMLKEDKGDDGDKDFINW